MNIEGISGRQYDSEFLTLNDATYHITAAGGVDVTNDIRRADKLALWPSFDVDKENRRLSNERNGGYGPAGKLEDSTTVILGGQLLNDPLAAPLDTLNKAINQVFTAPGVLKALVIVAAVGVGVYLVKRQLRA